MHPDIQHRDTRTLNYEITNRKKEEEDQKDNLNIWHLCMGHLGY